MLLFVQVSGVSGLSISIGRWYLNSRGRSHNHATNRSRPSRSARITFDEAKIGLMDAEVATVMPRFARGASPRPLQHRAHHPAALPMSRRGRNISATKAIVNRAMPLLAPACWRGTASANREPSFDEFLRCLPRQGEAA
jgi:hypothetical protein